MHREKQLYHNASLEKHNSYVESCASEIKSEDFYSNLSSAGLTYGAAFQKLSNIRHGDDACVFDVNPHRWDDETCGVIHPGTLDAMIHSVFCSMPKNRNRSDWPDGSRLY